MFEKLCVSSWILAQLSGLGISKPSPIQRHCIPPLLAWLDGTVWSWPRLVRENICICHSYFTYFVSWPIRYLRGFSDTNKRVCKPDRGQFHESLSGNEPPHHRGHRRSWHHQAESGPPGRLADHIRTNSTFSLSKVKYLVLNEGEEIEFLKVKQTDNYFVQYNTQFMQWVWFTIIIRYQRQICKRKWLEKLSWVHLTSFDIGVTITVEKLVHAIEAHTSVSWTELEQEDEKVGEIMVQVNSWTREAEFKLEQNDWGKNHDVIVRKKKIKQGIDPDVDSKMKKKSKLKLMKSRRRNF